MKKTIRKIPGLFLLLVGSLPSLITLCFLLRQQMIQYEMKEKLEQSLLQTITINEKDVVWMDDHEIWVNEHMFDIHSKKLENGTYIFTGLYDEEETKLVKTHKAATEKNSKEGQLLTRLMVWLHNIFYDETPADLHLRIKPNYITTFLTPALACPFMERLTPPPQPASVYI